MARAANRWRASSTRPDSFLGSFGMYEARWMSMKNAQRKNDRWCSRPQDPLPGALDSQDDPGAQDGDGGQDDERPCHPLQQSRRPPPHVSRRGTAVPSRCSSRPPRAGRWARPGRSRR